jgi:HSP20 family protein
MLGYWDPFSELSRVQDRFFGRPTQEREYAFKPAVDIYEDQDGIHVQTDLAGVKPEDIKVEVENNVLTISGQRRMEHEDKRDGYHRVERYYGSFTRSFALSDEVSNEEIDAKFENGVLTLKLPKRPAAKKREIAVKATPTKH